MNKNKINYVGGNSAVITVIAVVIALLFFVGLFILSSRKGDGLIDTKYDAFAQCLASEGTTMYGAAWCSHCQNEKKGFGTSFKFINYVECPENTKLCTELGINSYPTWIFGNGERYVGEQGIENLSKISGCALDGSITATSTTNGTTTSQNN